MTKKDKCKKQKRYFIVNLFCPTCSLSKIKNVDISIDSKENNNDDNDYITFTERENTKITDNENNKGCIDNDNNNAAQATDKSRSSQPLPDIPIVPKSKSKRRTPLIPDLLDIFNLPYYWGEMDRYEAEAELQGMTDGTFLLRDSAQEEFLFSVSFNRFGRTIHARVEYLKGYYSFDQHLINAPTIEALLSFFQNTDNRMFYHPLCIHPRNRQKPFTLQKLCIGTICSYLKYYEDAYELNVPRKLLHQLHLSSFKVPIHYYNFYNESLFTNTTSSN